MEGPMSYEERNIATVRRLYDALNEGDVSILDEVVDPSYPNWRNNGKEHFIRMATAFRTAFPDWRVTIDKNRGHRAGRRLPHHRYRSPYRCMARHQADGPDRDDDVRRRLALQR